MGRCEEGLPMMNAKSYLLLVVVLLTTACAQAEQVPKEKLSKPEEGVQKAVDTFVESRRNILKKAKGLEGKLKEIEEKRLKEIEAFGK